MVASQWFSHAKFDLQNHMSAHIRSSPTRKSRAWWATIKWPGAEFHCRSKFPSRYHEANAAKVITDTDNKPASKVDTHIFPSSLLVSILSTFKPAVRPLNHLTYSIVNHEPVLLRVAAISFLKCSVILRRFSFWVAVRSPWEQTH